MVLVFFSLLLFLFNDSIDIADEEESIERVAEFFRKIEDELAPGDAKIPNNASEDHSNAMIGDQ